MSVVGEMRAARSSAACSQHFQDSLGCAGRVSSELVLVSIMSDALRCQLIEHAERNARLLEVHQKLDPQTVCTMQVDALMKMDWYSAILEKDPVLKSDELVNTRTKACDDCLRRARSRRRSARDAYRSRSALMQANFNV